MQPFTTGAFYVNNLLDEDEARIRAAYGRNWERLVALKNKYDPTNLFRLKRQRASNGLAALAGGSCSDPTRLEAQ